jgi:hypothetical protein
MSPTTPAGKQLRTSLTPSNTAPPRPKKRARRDTIEREETPQSDSATVPAVSREPSATLDDDAMDTYTPSTIEDGSLIVPIGDTTALATYIDLDAILHMGHLLCQQTEGGYNMLDFIVTQRILACEEDALPLQHQLVSKFTGPREPVQYRYHRRGEEIAGDMYSHPGVSKSGHLMQSKDVATRSIRQRSFLWACPIATVWPPPLTMDTERPSNLLWSFELNDPSTEMEAL